MSVICDRWGGGGAAVGSDRRMRNIASTVTVPDVDSGVMDDGDLDAGAAGRGAAGVVGRNSRKPNFCVQSASGALGLRVPAPGRSEDRVSGASVRSVALVSVTGAVVC
jgi:hypothetical protein